MKNLFLLLFSSGFLFVSAQDTLTGPHMGRLKLARGYHIESLGCDNYLEIYLFNEAMEPVMNNGIRGEIKFVYDKTTVTSPLSKYGIDGFTAKIASPEFIKYTVTLDLLEQLIISADFANECIVPTR